MEHTDVPTTFRDSYRSRIKIDDIVTAKVSITTSRAVASAIRSIVITESIYKEYWVFLRFSKKSGFQVKQAVSLAFPTQSNNKSLTA